jgi:hypothetical protein
MEKLLVELRTFGESPYTVGRTYTTDAEHVIDSEMIAASGLLTVVGGFFSLVRCGMATHLTGHSNSVMISDIRPSVVIRFIIVKNIP